MPTFSHTLLGRKTSSTCLLNTKRLQYVHAACGLLRIIHNRQQNFAIPNPQIYLPNGHILRALYSAPRAPHILVERATRGTVLLALPVLTGGTCGSVL
jgi:hypothetical protein